MRVNTFFSIGSSGRVKTDPWYLEIQTFAHTYANYEKDREGSSDPEAQALAAKAYLIEGHTRTRLEQLRQLAQKIGTMANDSFFKRWTNRMRFVLLENELEKNVAGKDRLMDELRRVQERSVPRKWPS